MVIEDEYRVIFCRIYCASNLGKNRSQAVVVLQDGKPDGSDMIRLQRTAVDALFH